ncbi:MAG: cytochrome P450 [Novosphingobium sp.]|nr:cytochrome P450 [Novosphingobium sp.]
MPDYTKADYYTDDALVDDPHSYFRFLREQGPVTRLPHRNVFAITGYEETVQVMLDAEHFSSINAVTGPIPDLPFTPEGDDITAQVEEMRGKVAFTDTIVTQDGTRHADLRSVMARLFTPSRLKALEPTLRATADAMIDEFIGDGHVDLPAQYGGPFATLVIADLLGVPEADRAKFREALQSGVPMEFGLSEEEMLTNPLMKIGKFIAGYIAKRRVLNHPLVKPFAAIGRALTGKAKPDHDDILTDLATARFPDGGKPKLADLAGIGAFLFGAGQDTTNRLLANSFRIIATRPDIQQTLRDHPERIEDFIEEILRFDGSVKSAGRLCVKTATVGGVEIKAGATLLLTHMGANRDPKRFENPDEFNMDRPKLKEHLAFGRGAHTCIGSPLARYEVRVSIERLLARLGNIRISKEQYGPDGTPLFEYEATYILRVLKSLHLEFDAIS